MILARCAALALLVGVVCPAGVVRAQEAQEKPAAPAWKPFQELAFMAGAWSGTADGSGRVGGRVTRWSAEMGGTYFVQRGSTVFAAQSGQPEDVTEEVAYFAYDRDRRKYVASCYFSTGVIGSFDVDFPAEGVVRLVSTSLLNLEAGTRARVTIAKKSDADLSYLFEVAPAGKDFVPFVASKMSRK
jgi:hypothetical protein